MTEAATEDKEAAPVLVVAPGMTFAQVANASTVKLATPKSPDGAWWAQPHEEHCLKIDHPKVGLTLPPSQFSLVEADKRVVLRVRSTTQLGYVDLPAALALVDTLHDLFVGAGWEARTRYPAERIEWMFKRQAELRAGIWKPLPDIRKIAEPSAGWRIDVEMRRAVEAGTGEARAMKLTSDAYLVTAVLTDELQ